MVRSLPATRNDLEAVLALAMRHDRSRLRSEAFRLIKRAADSATETAIAAWYERLDRSLAVAQGRQSSLPVIEFPDSLPITAHVAAIRRHLETRSTLVVCGETGSGKSTQLPKILLTAGFGITGTIAHTQPRRIAARSVATRLAEELQTAVGKGIGFKVRFTDRTAPETWVKLMTDGVLLAETQSDRDLDRYDAIIVDEAHERSLNIDFLLGYLHRLRERRPELRVIVTSATLDAERFASHFRDQHGPAPIHSVAGRTYPVDIRYRPLIATDEVEQDDPDELDPLDGLVEASRELLRDSSGDLLVFFATESEIRSALKRLQGVFQDRIRDGSLELLPLYARLGVEEQQRIFRPAKGRRIVLATNVAESSLTVPGVRSVIDLGTARIARYAPRSKVQRLPIEPISRASADQRAGRCGRLGPGICIRLFSEADYAGRDRFTTPEIRRTDLASVILRTETLKLGRVDAFPFLDPPLPEAIRDGYRTLFELGAVDEGRRVTELGRRLGKLPVHPRVARMLLAAHEEGCLHEMTIVAAGLEIQDPRERPTEKRQAADERHREFLDERSDFLSLLKLWDFHRDLDANLSSSRWRKALHDRFLSANRIREWVDLHRQLVALVRESGWEIGERQNDPVRLHRALLTGLLSGIAQRTDKGDYMGAGGLRFHLWPGSGLANRRPEWIVVNEIVETSRRFGRTAAAIDLRWVEPIASHLVSKSYGEARWNAKSETAIADERVTLFGLTIVARRPVPLGPRDPAAARQVFLEQGLVETGFDGGIPPLVKNRETLERLAGDAAKLRDAGRLVEAGTILQFYQERVPDSVYDAASLRRALRAQPDLASQLTMAEADLLPSASQVATSAFPDQIRWGTLDIPLDYRFEPGSKDDGVTATIPAAGLEQVSPRQMGWLIPGLIEPRIVAMIRALPKPLRRNLVPAPDTARAVAADLIPGEGDFVEAVARRLSRIAGEPIAPELLVDRLPDHLQVNLKIVDEKGEVLAEGRDLQQLRSEIAPEQIGAVTIRSEDWNQTGLKDWTWQELPESVTVRHGDLSLVAHPGVVDCSDSVSLQLFDHAATAEKVSRRGLARLGWLQKRKEIRTQVQWLPGKERWSVLGRSIVDSKSLDDDLALLIANLAWIERRPLPRDAASWQARVSGSHEAISIATQDAARVLPQLFQRYHEVQLRLEAIEGKLDSRIRDDIRQQLADWFVPHFLVAQPWVWLQHLPRYLQALLLRLEKLPAASAKDREILAIVAPHAQRARERREKDERSGRFDPELETYRWWIEELRVSLWAQGLGTSCKVSPQRLEKQWEAVGR